MALQIGIVGLPNVGKSTLFNAITKKQVEASNYPFCTIDPNVGVVKVPDPRLDELKVIEDPQKIVPAVIEFVDIAGLVRDAHKGEGLGNKFLSHINKVDAIVHVVRLFNDPNIQHVENMLNPEKDMQTVNTELILKDLEVLEKILRNAQKDAKSGTREFVKKVEVLEKLHVALNANKPASSVTLTEEEKEFINDVHLLTQKPVLYVFNVSENDFVKPQIPDKLEKLPHVVISAQIEAELSELSPEEAKDYMESLGTTASGLERLIQASYKLLGLITFFTAGEKEAKAWTITKGTKAPQAAGAIHSDFERGFISADVVEWDQLVKAGSWAAAREQGLLRGEGKEYIVHDGDVMIVKFNV